MTDWLARARVFRADDPDPDTRAELDRLLATADSGELQERFKQRLEFGTAGLRGLLGAGDNRMNRRVVAETTAAVCAHLAGKLPDARARGVCVGFDGRHKSRDFAEEVAAVAAGAGYVVHAFEGPVPTPLLAFATLRLGAAAGVMITASHNPAAYNGYKLYLHDGAQLREPDAGEIARRIERFAADGGSVIGLPRRAAGLPLRGMEAVYLEALAAQLDVAPRSATPHAGEIARPFERFAAVGGSTLDRPWTQANEPPREMEAESLESLAAERTGEVASGPAADGVDPREHDASSAAPAPRVAYTAMHGVGAPLAAAALRLAGVRELDSVAEQAEPDPDFPTVAFPNPEEPGAMDRVLALARTSNAELALANDPDADRLAVALRADDGMRVLSGNELGVLLADYLLSLAPRDGRNLIVTTVVSTPLAARIAQHHGARCEITLTGFKWIVSRALQLVSEHDLRFVLGFEEALGYCIGELVHDKDGISAAAHVVRMASWHAARGRTLHQALEQLYRQHGLHDSRQVSIALRGDAGIARVRDALARLRAKPPEHIAGLPVTRTIDLRDPARTGLTLPATDLLSFELESRHRITVRPSGTEPKLKIYLDCAADLTAHESLRAGQARVRALSERIGAAFIQDAGLD